MPNSYGYYGHEYIGLNGLPVKHTPHTHPYSYDEFVIKKSPEYDKTDAAFYSDRFKNWYDRDTINTARQELNIEHGDYFWAYYDMNILEKFLQKVTGDNYQITAIVQGCNVSNGYPYWVIFHKPITPHNADTKESIDDFDCKDCEFQDECKEEGII